MITYKQPGKNNITRVKIESTRKIIGKIRKAYSKFGESFTQEQLEILAFFEDDNNFNFE